MHTWQLQDAKAHFSEVIREATTTGPQEITVRGEPTAVILSTAEYQRLAKPKPNFVEFIRNSPLAKIDIQFERDKSNPRAIDL